MKKFSAFCFLLCGLSAWAQPVPKITSISREWLQRGTATEATIIGENLSDITRFVFSDENELSASITAAKSSVRLESEAGVFSSETPNDSTRVTVKIAVNAETGLGSRELRVVTPTGVSNPVKLRISDLPETVEVGGKHSVTNAQQIELPTGVAGLIGEMGQVDYFRFTAKKSEHVIVDINASRLGSPLDSSLAILDLTGKELARNEDANGFDSLIDFLVPEDGEYLIQLRDFRFQGGADYKYHFTAGAIPYLASIFPFGGERGKLVEVALTGQNLDDVKKISMKLDPAAPTGSIDVRAHTAKGFSNARAFDVGAFPERMEQEPNDVLTNATLVTVPGTVNGRIGQAKDVDIFKFKVAKGQRLIFEVRASAFGSQLDAILILRGTNNAVIQENNGQGAVNARIDQTFDAAGEYYISVRDLMERGGDNYTYRLAIEPPGEAGFSAQITSDTPRVSRGGRTAVRVEVSRAGFGGAVEITGEDLPPGVTCEPLLIKPELNGDVLEISASDDAELGSTPLKLLATAEVRGKRVTEPVQAVAGVKQAAKKKAPKRKVAVAPRVAVKEAYLTVLDAPPFTVDWVTLSAQLQQNGSKKVRGEITRKKGFKGEVAVSLEGFVADPANFGTSLAVAPVTVKSNATEFEMSVKANLQSEIGTRSILLKAEASGVTQYSRRIPLTVTEFPFTLSTSLPRLSIAAVPAGSTSAAGEAEFTVKAVRRGLFTEAINLSIEGLPEGIVATTTNLAPNVTEALFKLTATEKAKPHTNAVTFTIVGRGSANGADFEGRAPGVALTVNPPSEGEETAKK